MKLMTIAKRQIAAAVLVAGATCLALASLQATPRCPLPASSSSTSTTSSNDNSPGQQGQLVAVLHNDKNILCLPQSAVSAHLKHGDTLVEFTCTKGGNNTPGGI